MGFEEKSDPPLEVAICDEQCFFSLWETELNVAELAITKQKAHSSKPNEKLGKIAFRLPVVIFVTLQPVLTNVLS